MRPSPRRNFWSASLQFFRSIEQPAIPFILSFHSVLIEFSTFFGSPGCTMSERQLRSFGDLVSTAIEAGGQLENAFATCFLEHAEQIGVWKVLRPFLSRTDIAKAKA
jgi:hypothetical protein